MRWDDYTFMKAISVEDVSKKFILAHDRPKNLAEAMRGVGKRKRREDFWALKDVSFEVKCGEAIGIVGRNGAGKSTLLKLITGIMDPTHGRIRKRGRVCSLIEVGAGFHPEMTGRENIYLNGSILGMNRREIDGKFDEIVEFSGLEDFIDTPVKRYSSGMYARLGFSVAAHVSPDILIVDEVLSVGDADFQKRCMGKMGEVSRAEGRAVVFVSHNLSAVRSLCSSAVYLRQGALAYWGTADEAISHYLSYLNAGANSAFEDNPERTGNGSLRLTSARALDHHGNPSTTVVAGESMTVEFDYVNPTGVKKVSLRFTISNQAGVAVTHVHTSLTNYVISDLPREGTFACTIPCLPLPTGSYRVAIMAEAQGDTADFIPNALVFDVVRSVFYEVPATPDYNTCACMVHHQWEHYSSGERDALTPHERDGLQQQTLIQGLEVP